MKVLFIGGTGLISTAVSQRAVERDIELHVLNRGNHNDVLPEKVNTILCDINDEKAVRKALKGKHYDAIVDWIAFTEEDVKRDVRLFKDKTDQYVFISSASAYQKPLPKTPVTEDMPLGNPYWEYSENKRRCEEYLFNLNEEGFSVTVIRPSHTYDEHSLILELNSHEHPFTMLHRILERQPLAVPGDGESLWTLTYNYDFAEAFLDVLGNEEAYGEAFHLTANKVYTWNEITKSIFAAVGVKPDIIHIPTELVLKHFPGFEEGLVGDKLHNAVFDNSKIKAIAHNYCSETDYPDVAKRAVGHYMENPELQTVDEEFLKRYDALIEDYLSGSE